MIYSYRREVLSCSFRHHGQFSGALDSEASDEWASRFLFICTLKLLFITSMPKPHRTNTFIIMKKREFVKYETPQVEVIEVEVEKGFAGSDGVGTDDDEIA